MRGLIAAAKNGDLPKTSRYLSRDNLDVNSTDEDGRSALHYAVKGHLGIAEQLLKHKADPNLTDAYRATPLHRATGYYKLVELLLNNKAKVNCENEWGYIPLHEAALKGHTRIIDILVENNADVNHQNQYGDSPLHFACQRGETRVVTNLLSHKAFVCPKNNEGRLPVDKARAKGHLEIVDLLEKQAIAPVTPRISSKRTQSLIDFLNDQQADQLKLPVSDVDILEEKEETSGVVAGDVGKAAVGDILVDEIWAVCRSILETENLSMNEWKEIRHKLKEALPRDQWNDIKSQNTEVLKAVKKKCKKHLKLREVTM